MGVPFPFPDSNLSKREMLLSILCLIVIFAGIVYATRGRKPRPTIEDRVNVLEVQVQEEKKLREEAEEVHQETVFGLWETINVTEKRCEECLHSCGGID